MPEYNASDRADIRRAEREARITTSARIEVIVNLMSTAAGREWVLSILERCHLFSTSFSVDSPTMAFFEGERNIGLQFFNDILAAVPDQYIVMMQERNQRDAARSAAAELARGQDPDGGIEDPS